RWWLRGSKRIAEVAEDALLAPGALVAWPGDNSPLTRARKSKRLCRGADIVQISRPVMNPSPQTPGLVGGRAVEIELSDPQSAPDGILVVVTHDDRRVSNDAEQC